MAPGTTSRLSGLQFVNPHLAGDGALGHRFLTVPACGHVPVPGTPGPLAARVAGAGRMFTLEDWNITTHGTSLLVLRSGQVVHEWYTDGLGPEDLFLGASMSKSVLAHLVGVAIAAGALRLSDRVVDHVPELAGTGYQPCTVRDVATMTSGVDWVEDHRDSDSLASRLTACFSSDPADDDAGDSRALLGQVAARTPPGNRWEYCTADSQVLDWVRERATGSTYDEALAVLWRRLGCTSDAVVGTDATGVPMAGGALAATTRDWARIAALQVDGTCSGERILDPAWVESSSTPPLPFMRQGRLPSTITTHAGFGMHWWPLDDAGRRVTADGSRGQFGYVDRDADVVVVKTSRWPYDDVLADRQCRDLSYLGLQAVADAASRDATSTVTPTPQLSTRPPHRRPPAEADEGATP